MPYQKPIQLKGEVYGKRDLSPNVGQSTGTSQSNQASAAKKGGPGLRRKKK